jgi:hypothetical protein
MNVGVVSSGPIKIATYPLWQERAPPLREPKEPFTRDAGYVRGNRAVNNPISGDNKHSRRNLREWPDVDPCVTALHLQHRLFARLLVNHHPFVCGCGGFDRARDKHIAFGLKVQARQVFVIER